VFDHHQITVIERYKDNRGEYIFANPKSIFYGMYIIFRQDTIIIYGDIRPCVIFSQPGINLKWLMNGVKTPNYLFQKAICGVKSEYDPEATKKLAEEVFVNSKKLIDINWEDENDVYDVLDRNDDILCYNFKHCETLRLGLEKFCKMINDMKVMGVEY
jgi:hypothetical protein